MTFQINQPTRCNNFSSLLLDVYSYVQLNMFRASSRPLSGAQQLQWQLLVLPSERDDSSAVGRGNIPFETDSFVKWRGTNTEEMVGATRSLKKALFLSQIFSRMNTATFLYLFILHLPAYEDGTKCSETSAYKIQTFGKLPRIKHKTLRTG